MQAFRQPPDGSIGLLPIIPFTEVVHENNVYGEFSGAFFLFGLGVPPETSIDISGVTYMVFNASADTSVDARFAIRMD